MNIYGLGTVLIDYFCKCTEADLQKFKLEKGHVIIGSDNLIFNLLNNLDFSYHYAGGTTANILRTAQALGCTTQFIGSIYRKSRFSDLFIQIMENNNIKTNLIIKSGNGLSIALILVTPDGEKTIVYTSNGPGILLEDIDNNSFYYADIFLTDANLCDGSIIENTITSLLMKKNNNAFAMPCSLVQASNNRQSILKCIDLSKIIFGNIYDYANIYMLSSNLEEISNYLLDQKHKSKVYVVTNKNQGASAIHNGQIFHVSSKIFDQETIIDTTGAGDFFAGAFLKSYLSGLDLEKCLQFSHEIAAQNIIQLGTEVNKLMNHIQ